MSKDEGPTQEEMDIQSVKWGIEEAETQAEVDRLHRELGKIRKDLRDRRFAELYETITEEYAHWDEGEKVNWRLVRDGCENMISLLRVTPLYED